MSRPKTIFGYRVDNYSRNYRRSHLWFYGIGWGKWAIGILRERPAVLPHTEEQ